MMLFDKLIEERETQAAESLRIMAPSGVWSYETLARTAFHAITMMADLGQPGLVSHSVKVPVTQ